MSRAVLLFLCSALAVSRAGAQQPPAPHDSLTGAVRAVDTHSRTIEVTAGVGMALRTVRLQVPPDIRITAKGSPLKFELLVPGDIVRITFGNRGTGNVAYTIERVGDMNAGRESR